MLWVTGATSAPAPIPLIQENAMLSNTFKRNLVALAIVGAWRGRRGRRSSRRYASDCRRTPAAVTSRSRRTPSACLISAISSPTRSSRRPHQYRARPGKVSARMPRGMPDLEDMFLDSVASHAANARRRPDARCRLRLHRQSRWRHSDQRRHVVAGADEVTVSSPTSANSRPRCWVATR